MADNSTNRTPLAVIGLPGSLFDVIHVTALVVLPISAIISVGVLIYMLRQFRKFFSRSVGDRMIVYLAVCDLMYSLSHIMDHAYMIVTRNHPPDVACAAFAFCLNEFILGQALVVIYAALNAFALVVLQKKLSMGKYDWRLLVYALGTPTLVGLLGVGTGHFGPTGAWCYIDLRKPLGPLLNNIVGAVMIVTFLFTVVCYVGIWLKIRQVAQLNNGNRKYNNTARVMMLFVAAYIMQWWAAAAYTCWTILGKPHSVITWAAVFFSNLGGLFNFLAYTFIRKRYQNNKTNPDETSHSNQVPVIPQNTQSNM